ncbi:MULTISPECIES: hypothetical protein [Mycolicibacterium]|uniref:hypothetical protein n=1 Tax=Mycolicibacterium TaxID=1866885 RepID=UPI001CDD2832|nr:hypothetical protein [Mycolicibacterium fortuitum]
MVDLYPDWMDERTRTEFPDLAVHAVRLGQPWNGLPSAVVTEAEWRRFIGAHAANDRNGTYRPDGIHATDSALIYIDTEDNADGLSVEDCDGFPRVGTDANGDALYEISGWNWNVEETSH